MDKNGYLDLIPFVQSQKEKYMAFLDGILEPAMALHGVVGSNQYAFDLDNAAGKQLDIIGEYIGVSRVLPFRLEPEEEVDFADRIKARVVAYDVTETLEFDGEIFWIGYDETEVTPDGGETTIHLYGKGLCIANPFTETPEIGDVLAVKSAMDIYFHEDAFYVLQADDMMDVVENSQGFRRIWPDGTLLYGKGRTYYFEYIGSYESGMLQFKPLQYDPLAPYYPPDTRNMRDDEYRNMIKLRIARNNWDGTNEGAEQIYRTILGDSINLQHVDNQDGSISVKTNSTASNRMIQILNATDNLLCPAGIGYTVEEIDSNASVTMYADAEATGIEIYDYFELIGDDDT